MNSAGNQAFVLAGLLTALASAAHLACIILGAPAFRLMGAGERMASAVEAGKVRPILVTFGIAVVLAVWTAYAWSAAGLIGPLPFTQFVLPAVAVVFTARGCAAVWLKPLFPENSDTFWRVSSGICLVVGTLYALGSAQAWARL
jgi:hypothetical protein